MASRHDLSLQKKAELMFDYKDGNSLSQRVLSENYYISLGSVSNILKRRKEYLHDYETNQNQQVKRKFQNVYSQKLLDEHKLIDVYIDSKATRQTTLEDFFEKKEVLYCSLKEVFIEIV